MEPIKHRESEAHGFSAHQLRTSRHFVQPAAGVSMFATSADDLANVCRAVAKILPADAIFTHLTSARLRGWWMPLGADPPIIACSWKGAPHLDRRGVFVRRCDVPPEHRQRIGDLAIASPEWTIVELAEHLALLDLVAIIDSALQLGHTTIDRIRATMVPGRRGVRVLRQALDLADGRSESWWESMLRLLHVLSGFDVDPQHVVVNAAGVEVARADLRIRGTNRLAEYDGADHRERQQHQGDLRREKAVHRAGLERYGYIASEIIHEPAAIVRDAETAKGLPHTTGRADVWRWHARRASLTSTGQAQLAQRLQRFVRTTSRRRRKP